MIKPPSSSEQSSETRMKRQMKLTRRKKRVLSVLLIPLWHGLVCCQHENSKTSNQGNFTVCVDAGHQGSWVDMSAQEPMAPGSSQTKNKATTGTSGNFSKVPEYEVNLEVSTCTPERADLTWV